MTSLPSPLKNYKATVIGCLAVAGASIVSLVFGESSIRELWHLQDQQAAFERDLFDLQRRNADLREQIRRLEHDPGEIERRARAQLGLVRPGEVVYVSESELISRLRP